MRIVSFKVAKAIKEAGFEQDKAEIVYLKNGETFTYESLFDYNPNACCDAPTYFEVFIWLWEKKGIYISIDRVFTTDGVRVACSVSYGVNIYRMQYRDNPDEAVIAAIEYLVEQDLIK